MTADLKSARAALERHARVLPGSALAEPIETLLTAMDQAAEALKPFAEEAFVWHGSYRNDYRPKVGEAQEDASYDIGDLRRAATVYATLKPVDTKEGEGA